MRRSVAEAGIVRAGTPQSTQKVIGPDLPQAEWGFVFTLSFPFPKEKNNLPRMRLVRKKH